MANGKADDKEVKDTYIDKMSDGQKSEYYKYLDYMGKTQAGASVASAETYHHIRSILAQKTYDRQATKQGATAPMPIATPNPKYARPAPSPMNTRTESLNAEARQGNAVSQEEFDRFR